MGHEEETNSIDNSSIIKDVHALRLQIAEATAEQERLSNSVNRGPGGRELSLCKTKLQEAKMWLGKVLEQLGSELPEQFRDEPKK